MVVVASINRKRSQSIRSATEGDTQEEVRLTDSPSAVGIAQEHVRAVALELGVPQQEVGEEDHGGSGDGLAVVAGDDLVPGVAVVGRSIDGISGDRSVRRRVSG